MWIWRCWIIRRNLRGCLFTRNYFSIMKELEEAKASFQQNSFEQLNTGNGNSNLHQSFLFSSQRNGKKPSIPSYLLMSTINNGQNRGFVRGGPAQQGLQNFEEHNPAQQGQQNFGEETGPAINNSEKIGQEITSFPHPNMLKTVGRPNRSGVARDGPATTSFPHPNMLNPVGRKGSNFNPNQQPHNLQNPQPPMSNLEKKLAAFAASLNN